MQSQQHRAGGGVAAAGCGNTAGLLAVSTMRDDPIRRRRATWPALAVVGLLLFTVSILAFNQRHSGDPLKMRREMRKF